MRIKLLAALLLAGTVLPAERPVTQSKKREYVHSTFGKRAVISSAGHAALGEATGHPKEWGRGPAGFGKRMASGFATHIVKNSIQYPVAAIRHEDLRYHRSTDPRFSHRLGHALASTVVTQKTTTGRKTVASGRISGAMGSGLISRAWQPASTRTVGAGLTSGGIALGADAAANVAQEFWPRKKGVQTAVRRQPARHYHTR